MKEIEDNISLLISTHFPQFYNEEGSTFVDFVKEYYSWAQQSNNFLYFARNFTEYRDIDKTIDQFLIHFKEKYIVGVPVNPNTIRFDVKKATDSYRTKGTERGARLFMSREYGISDVNVYFPGSDIIKASDGEWIKPQYLELSVTDQAKTFIGKQVTGSISEAKAYVTRVSRISLKGHYVDVAYLSDLEGDFITGENITVDGIIQDSPRVVGSMTSVTLLDPGKNFSQGQVLDVLSSRKGVAGRARVDQISTANGETSFSIADGGLGYSNTTTVTIATKTMNVSARDRNGSRYLDFALEETISQPLANVDYTTSNTIFYTGDWVQGSNATANLGSGIVLNSDYSGTGGNMLIQTYSGTFVGSSKIIRSRWFNANSSIDSSIGFISISSNPFIDNDQVLYTTATGNTPLTGLTNATAYYVVQANTGGIKLSSSLGGSALTVSNGLTEIGHILTNSTTPGGVVTSAVDRTATGKLIAANTDYIGLHSIVNSFDGSPYNFIQGNATSVRSSILEIGLGTGAGFSIGAISNTYTANVNTDIIGSNNQSFTPYTTVALNAVKYDFPKANTANLSSTIVTALANVAVTLGSILSIKSVNPGQGYTFAPLVQVKDTSTYAYFNQRLEMFLTSVSGTFVIGETISQAATGAFGIITSSSIDNILNVRVKSLNKFITSSPITGISSSATASITRINRIENSPVLGADASVLSSVTAGSIKTLSLIGSGYGYQDGESVTLTSNTSTFPASGFVNLNKQGFGNGYFKSTKGFLNSDKYIHDGDFYQNYSYQIKSSLPLDVYSETLKQLIHVAGTKLFGSVIKTSVANNAASLSESVISIN